MSYLAVYVPDGWFELADGRAMAVTGGSVACDAGCGFGSAGVR